MTCKMYNSLKLAVWESLSPMSINATQLSRNHETLRQACMLSGDVKEIDL